MLIFPILVIKIVYSFIHSFTQKCLLSANYVPGIAVDYRGRAENQNNAEI